MSVDFIFPPIAILLLTACCVVLFLVGFGTALKRSGCWPNQAVRATIALGLSIAAWAIVVGSLARSGFFSNFAPLPPRLLIVLVGPAIALALLWRVRTLQAALEYAPVAWLIYLQTFRIIVELLLWNRYRAGVLPVQMTFAGRNFDIVAGLTAPIVGFIWQRTRNRKVAVAWNVAGLVLLLNIIVVAILSMRRRSASSKMGPRMFY